MSDAPSENGGKRTGGRFQPGNPGGPGRPPGSRNRTTLAAMALLEGQAEQVMQALVTAALEGDVAAGKVLLDRIAPPVRSRRVELPDMPRVANASDVPAAQAEVLRAVADGELSPEEGASITAVVEASRRAIESAELLARIEALETAAAKAKGARR